MRKSKERNEKKRQRKQRTKKDSYFFVVTYSWRRKTKNNGWLQYTHSSHTAHTPHVRMMYVCEEWMNVVSTHTRNTYMYVCTTLNVLSRHAVFSSHAYSPFLAHWSCGCVCLTLSSVCLCVTWNFHTKYASIIILVSWLIIGSARRPHNKCDSSLWIPHPPPFYAAATTTDVCCSRVPLSGDHHAWRLVGGNKQTR